MPLATVHDFVRNLELSSEAADFMFSLPPTVSARVISSFDPSSSKDGNVEGRLQAFAKSILVSRGGAAIDTWSKTQRPSGRGGTAVARTAPHAVTVATYCQQLGLDEVTSTMLQAMPGHIQQVVLRDFDPSGTMDGRVGGRLLGFLRGVWAQTLGLSLAEVKEATDMLRGQSDEAQMQVMAQFDATGTKDGNVLARLQKFVNAVAARLAATAAAPAIYHERPREQQYTSWPGKLLAQAPRQPMAEFIRSWRVDHFGAQFLTSIPEEVQNVVLTSFNPMGTKDGNVWGRLFGFVRSVWIQRLGLDNVAVDFVKSLPEDVQRTVIVKFDPSRTKDGNVLARVHVFARSVAGSTPVASQWEDYAPVSRSVSPMPLTPLPANGALRPLRSATLVAPRGQWNCSSVQPSPAHPHQTVKDFAQMWGLSEQVEAFVGGLPDAVCSAVVADFDASGTKDGNVWGRLFGFVRAVWISKVGLQKDAVAYLKGQPESVQCAAMVDADLFSFSQPATLEEIQALVEQASESSWQYEDVEGHASHGVAASWHGDDGPMAMFAQQCNLDLQAVEAVLLPLDTEVRDAVMNDFDPGGTKDGNVLGRLEGFARSVDKRISRKRLAEASDDQGSGDWQRSTRARWR